MSRIESYSRAQFTRQSKVETFIDTFVTLSFCLKPLSVKNSSRRVGKRTEGDESGRGPRTDFTRDYDRIIFSSAFRRLQDKTQVFPLAKSDYVRTRLTHSLEVASVRRSLGMLCADVINIHESTGLKEFSEHDIGSVVAAACLMHDIGNPAFGHAGESAIQEWFEQTALVDKSRLSPEQTTDLLKFEGNAQGFRMLVNLQNPNQRGGLQLTSAVLGAFGKYPRSSVVEDSQTQGVSGKKFGYMQGEAELLNELVDELGLVKKAGTGTAWYRHPVAFLMEAADDICYNIMDVEDGYKAGLITFDQLRDVHLPWISRERLARAETFGQKQRQAEYFRAITINQLIHASIAVFDTNYDGLMTGNFDKELTSEIENADAFKKFKAIARTDVYPSRPVVEIEACGFEVTAGLLNAFVSASEIHASGQVSGRHKARTALQLLPGGSTTIDGKDLYQRILVMTDFVSGMTDSYAVQLYPRIRGIAPP